MTSGDDYYSFGPANEEEFIESQKENDKLKRQIKELDTGQLSEIESLEVENMELKSQVNELQLQIVSLSQTIKYWKTAWQNLMSSQNIET